MRLPIEEHLKHTWLVSKLAPDFELLDVWRYPIEIDETVPLDRFIDFSGSRSGPRRRAGEFRLQARVSKRE